MNEQYEYTYSECGLDNVVITGLPKPENGSMHIPIIHRLHSTITHELCMKTSRLSAKEIVYLITELEMTPKELADLFGKEEELVNLGELSIPEEVLIRMMALQNINVGDVPLLSTIAAWCRVPEKPHTLRITAIEHGDGDWVYRSERTQ